LNYASSTAGSAGRFEELSGNRGSDVDRRKGRSH